MTLRMSGSEATQTAQGKGKQRACGEVENQGGGFFKAWHSMQLVLTPKAPIYGLFQAKNKEEEENAH